MKKLLILTLILIIGSFFGCQNKETRMKYNEYKVIAEIEEKNKALAKQYIDAINKGDFEAFKELLSPDFAIYSPSGYPEPTSREKLIENYVEVRKAFPEFAWSIEDIIAANNKVICRIMIRGTFKGEIPDLPVTEKKFELSLITIMRIENEKVVEEWQEDDQLGFARQMGMELRPKESDE